MSSKLILIFNHRLTPHQENDAYASLGVNSIVGLPAELESLWMNIPPGLPEIKNYLSPMEKWLQSVGRTGDYVLIQGDFGACFLMVSFAFDIGLTPVYSTTRRQVHEAPQPDGSIKSTHRFSHQIYRKYGG